MAVRQTIASANNRAARLRRHRLLVSRDPEKAAAPLNSASVIAASSNDNQPLACPNGVSQARQRKLCFLLAPHLSHRLISLSRHKRFASRPETRSNSQRATSLTHLRANRRGLLLGAIAAGAAASVAAIPAIAAAETPDPVRGLIEKHKATSARFMELVAEYSDDETYEAEARATRRRNGRAHGHAADDPGRYAGRDGVSPRGGRCAGKRT
jgi:hypothetical protein